MSKGPLPQMDDLQGRGVHLSTYEVVPDELVGVLDHFALRQDLAELLLDLRRVDLGCVAKHSIKQAHGCFLPNSFDIYGRSRPSMASAGPTVYRC